MNLSEDAGRRAELRDQALSRPVTRAMLPRPGPLFIRLRAYLGHQADKLKKTKPDCSGLVSIFLGPTIDKGPTGEHFLLESGARLSFGLTLRESGSSSSLVEYRFHYCLPPGRSPAYLRFDLNPQAHAKPLAEPRCHLHPGLEEIRLPLPVLDPFEVLDRIFFVIEPALLST